MPRVQIERNNTRKFLYSFQQFIAIPIFDNRGRKMQFFASSQVFISAESFSVEFEVNFLN